MIDSKIINDPVFGFINISDRLILDLIKHPYVQRLTRIRQLGMANVVYPGASHTRFIHSIGALHLMEQALLSLRQKGVFLFDTEEESVKIAILLHDIGHGPFSHVLEHTLVHDITHEEISMFMMDRINKEFKEQLNLALSIFKNKYHKKFLHQLISSQLDIDRLDYLTRDSFFTGVREGNIGAERIIKMIDVDNDELVINEKGIYSIEHYLVARQSMYWQVYLHKTAVACEHMLINLLKRAKELIRMGENLFATTSLNYFLLHDITGEILKHDQEALDRYILLDDNDIWAVIKEWARNKDLVLSMLANNLINRKIFKVQVSNSPFTEEELYEKQKEISEKLSISLQEASYLIGTSKVGKKIYDLNAEKIKILTKEKNILELSEVSKLFNTTINSQKNSKYYLYYQRI